MGRRFQARRGSGRFTRNTPENTLGMHFNVHERKPNGEWCGAFNPSRVGETRPTHCHACGGELLDVNGRDSVDRAERALGVE